MRVRSKARLCALAYGLIVVATPATGSAQILTSGSAVNRSDPASATGASVAVSPPGAAQTVQGAPADGAPPPSGTTTAPGKATAPAGPVSSMWARRPGGNGGASTATTSERTTVAPAPSTESISGWRPLIDTKGVNMARYEADLTDCQTFASQNREADRANVKRSAVKGGLLTGGAAVAITVLSGGAALLPMMAGSLAGAAGMGALSGAAGGAVIADAAWRGTVSSCLSGRGYKVLN